MTARLRKTRFEFDLPVDKLGMNTITLIACLSLTGFVDCPNPLDPFEMTRTQLDDGTTLSEGSVILEDHRQISVAYVDNRETVDGLFFAGGHVSLINLSPETTRIISYRQVVELPPGSWQIVRQQGDVNVCLQHDRMILSKQKPISWYSPRTFLWQISITGHAGDFNGDGIVDGEDLGLVLGGWGNEYNIDDLSTLLVQWTLPD